MIRIFFIIICMFTNMYVLSCYPSNQAIKSYIVETVKRLFRSQHEKNSLLLFFFIFTGIFLLNELGNITRIIRSFRIFFVSLFFSWSIWSIIKIKGILHNCSKIITELTPDNSPIFLLFLNIFRHFLRGVMSGIILSLRITANLRSGELILSLISFMADNIVLKFGQILFTLLELLIGSVQAFIFIKLRCLFYKDMIFLFLQIYNTYDYKMNDVYNSKSS